MNSGGIYVFITEKPSVAMEYKKVLNVSPDKKTDGYIEGYSSYLNRQVVITWAVGHLIELANFDEQLNQKITTEKSKWTLKNIPFVPDTYIYKPKKQTIKQFNVVKKIFNRKDIDTIYYAGDSGREGIYIQALIRNQIFKADPPFNEKVVWIDSFTDSSIKNGIKDAKSYSFYLPMIEAGYLRAKFDWLIGMNFTRALSVKGNALLTCGRVQTPTLAMVVKRQRDIEKFVEQKYYGISAETSDAVYNWLILDDSPLTNQKSYFNNRGLTDKKKVESLISDFDKSKALIIDNVEKKKKTSFAPLLYNLADLQADCSKRFNFSPTKTLEIAQYLYENKLTTYPRTDARYLSSDMQNMFKKNGIIVPDRYVNDKKITDHFAIIPTFQYKEKIASLDTDKKNVYALINNRFANILKPPHVYNEYKVLAKVKGFNEFFDTTLTEVLEIGYKKDVEKKDIVIPKKGDIIKVNEFKLLEKKTTPPSLYTTGSLILAMEKCAKLVEGEDKNILKEIGGIGTSATRAGIIESLEKRKYIDISKKQQITPTPLGIELIKIVNGFDKNLVSPIKTAQIEEKLNNVSLGKKDSTLENDFQAYIINTTEDIKNGEINTSFAKYETFTCPFCKEQMKYGKYGYFCKPCGFSIGKEICGHKMSKADYKNLLEKGTTNKINFTSKNNKKFSARLVLDMNNKKTEFSFE